MKSQLTAAEAWRELGFTRNMIRHWCRVGWLAPCEPPPSEPAGSKRRRFLYNREDLLRANALAKEAVAKSARDKLEKAWEARERLQGAVRGERKFVKRPTSLRGRATAPRLRLTEGRSVESGAMYQPKPKVLRMERPGTSTEALNLGRELRALARMMR